MKSTKVLVMKRATMGDGWGGGGEFKIVQNSVTLFMDDPLPQF